MGEYSFQDVHLFETLGQDGSKYLDYPPSPQKRGGCKIISGYAANPSDFI